MRRVYSLYSKEHSPAYCCSVVSVYANSILSPSLINFMILFVFYHALIKIIFIAFLIFLLFCPISGLVI